MTYYLPTAEEVKQIRLDNKLTMAQISDLVLTGTKTWQQWEYNKRQMPAAIWHLLQIKLAGLDKLI